MRRKPNTIGMRRLLKMAEKKTNAVSKLSTIFYFF